MLHFAYRSITMTTVDLFFKYNCILACEISFSDGWVYIKLTALKSVN